MPPVLMTCPKTHLGAQAGLPAPPSLPQAAPAASALPAAKSAALLLEVAAAGATDALGSVAMGRSAAAVCLPPPAAGPRPASPPLYPFLLYVVPPAPPPSPALPPLDKQEAELLLFSLRNKILHQRDQLFAPLHRWLRHWHRAWPQREDAVDLAAQLQAMIGNLHRLKRLRRHFPGDMQLRMLRLPQEQQRRCQPLPATPDVPWLRLQARPQQGLSPVAAPVQMPALGLYTGALPPASSHAFAAWDGADRPLQQALSAAQLWLADVRGLQRSWAVAVLDADTQAAQSLLKDAHAALALYLAQHPVAQARPRKKF